ncbi:MAG: lysostaphin resistance A-like protein, partial [Salinibacter sp.]
NTDREVQTFVELEGGGRDAYRRMIETGRYQPYQWHVRHYVPHEARETTLRFTPRGRPYGFTEDWPEDAPGPALAADSARAIAEAQATRHWNVALSKYELVSASRQERPNGRVDHTFIYQRPDLKLGENGRYRLRLKVSGNELSEVKHFVKVPEAFQRRYENMRSANNTIATGGLIAVGLIYILGGCFYGLYWLLRHSAVKWRMAVVWGSIVAGLQFLASLNQLPLAWMSYDTAVGPQFFILQRVVGALAGAVGMGLLITLSFVAAEGLSRMAFGDHPRLWKVWSPEAASSVPILSQTMLGYLLVGIFFAYDVTLYLYAQDLLGWWNPSSVLFQPDILAHVAPWLSPIANALQAGFWEECLFRAVPLAGAALIGDRLGGRTWWIGGARLLKAVIFGAGHANYPAQPAYARLVELILPSIGFGLLYLSFGLLPGIVLHYAFDVAWMAQPLFVSEAPGAWISQVMVVVLTLVPLFAVFYGRLRTGAWTELAERFYNRSWSPDTETTVSTITVPPTEGLSRRIAVGCAVAGLVGLGAWVGGTSFTTYETPLHASRTEAEQTARTALREAGGNPEAWSMAATVQTPNDQEDRFVWQEGGPDAYRHLMGSYLDAPFWVVRFYSFADSLSVEERAEEYRVHWAPSWGLREVIHERPEAAPGDSLAEAQARALADSAVRARTTLNPDRLQRIGAEPTARPNRRDWTFTYADTTGYPLEQGQARVTVTLTGAEVKDVSRSVHVPESWQRNARSRRTDTQLLTGITGLLLGLLLVAGLIASIIWWARGPFRTWPFVGVAATLFVVLVASTANEWPTTLATLDTAQPYLTQILLSAIGPLVAAVFGAGAAGLLAGVLHPRIGGAEASPLGHSLLGGAGLGVLGGGLLSLASRVGPSLSPSWASYDALPTVLPWLDPLLDRVPSFIGLTLVLLLGTVVLHRWTKAGQTRRWGAAGMVVGIGFIMAGITGPSSLGTWALSGSLLSALFGLGYAVVARRDRSVIPTVAATVIGLDIVKAIVTAAHTYAVPGEALALVVVLGGGVLWTRLLRRRQHRQHDLEEGIEGAQE